MPRRTKNDADRITTHGDLSPGAVGGDYKVTQTIVNQRAEARRKTWRMLDEIDYPALVDDEDRRTKYTLQLALQLHRTFQSEGYTAFTSFLSLREAPIPEIDQKTPVYCLVTHRAEFSGALRHSWKFLHNPTIPKEKKQAHQDELNAQIGELLQTWSFDLRPPFAERLVATQFTYDPDSRRIAIGPPPHMSTAPDSFPDNVRTTSELLAFLSAVTGNPMVYLGDTECITSHYPLFKLAIALLDNKAWQLECLRVNADDPEEWDYINPAADAEVGRYKKTDKAEQETGGDK